MAEQEVILVTDSDDEVAVVSTTTPPSSSTGAAAFSAIASSSSSSSAAQAKETAAATATATPLEEATSTVKEQMECPICLQTCIHPARLPCGHIFCFLCVKGVAYKNRRCAMCRREIPIEFLDHPHLLYKIEETPPTSEDGYQWFYEGRNGWWQYDERTSQEIEEAYKRPDKFCTILVAGYVYVVDFETMLQQRQNEPSRKRQVKRDLATVPKKGVAGLRIDGTADPLESSAASVAAEAASSSSYPYQFHQRDHRDAGAGAAAAVGGMAASATATTSGTLSSSSAAGGSPRSPLPALVAHNLISTIAATDAAIRIASDIIDSTLAHASTDTHGSSSYDYHDHRGCSGSASNGSGAGRRGSAGSMDGGSGGGAGGSSSSRRALSPGSSSSSGSSRQDLLIEVQEALNISGNDDGLSGGGGNASASGLLADHHHHHHYRSGAGAGGAAASALATTTTPRLDFFSQTIDEFRSLALSNIAESSADSDSELDEGDTRDNGVVIAESSSSAADSSDMTDGRAAHGLNI